MCFLVISLAPFFFMPLSYPQATTDLFPAMIKPFHFLEFYRHGTTVFALLSYVASSSIIWLWGPPFCGRYPQDIPFYCWVAFPCMEKPSFAYPFTCWAISGLGIGKTKQMWTLFIHQHCFVYSKAFEVPYNFRINLSISKKKGKKHMPAGILTGIVLTLQIHLGELQFNSAYCPPVTRRILPFCSSSIFMVFRVKVLNSFVRLIPQCFWCIYKWCYLYF